MNTTNHIALSAMDQVNAGMRRLADETILRDITGFAEVITPEVNTGLFARSSVSELMRIISHEHLKMNGPSDRWNRDRTLLPGLLEESREWWAEHTRARLAEAAQRASKATDHRGMLVAYKATFDQLEVEFNAFGKKQAMVLEALRHPNGWHTWDFANAQGVELERSSFLVVPLKTPIAWTRKAFTLTEMADFMVGRGEYDRESRFNRDDNKVWADKYPVRVNMLGLREFFMDTEERARAWTSVYNGQFTSQRRKALMDMDWVVTNPPRRLNSTDSDAKNAWDAKVMEFKEGERGAPRNGEIHHLLGALNKQFDFGAALQERVMAKELEVMMAAGRNVYTGIHDSEADWECGRADFLGEDQPGARELRIKAEELDLFHKMVQTTLNRTNAAFEAVHGALAFQWVLDEATGKYTKITDQGQARSLSYAVWQSKRDAKKQAEWEEHQTLTLEAIRRAMEATYTA